MKFEEPIDLIASFKAAAALDPGESQLLVPCAQHSVNSCGAHAAFE